MWTCVSWIEWLAAGKMWAESMCMFAVCKDIRELKEEGVRGVPSAECQH